MYTDIILFFSRTSLHIADSKYQISLISFIGTVVQKTARNEQVCAHQKSYRNLSKFFKIFFEHSIQDGL